MLVSCRNLREAWHSFAKKAVIWLLGDLSNGSVPYHSLDTESSRSMGLVLPETSLTSPCILAMAILGFVSVLSVSLCVSICLSLYVCICMEYLCIYAYINICTYMHM